jgi:hypothetical protein
LHNASLHCNCSGAVWSMKGSVNAVPVNVCIVNSNGSALLHWKSAVFWGIYCIALWTAARVSILSYFEALIVRFNHKNEIFKKKRGFFWG